MKIFMLVLVALALGAVKQAPVDTFTFDPYDIIGEGLLINTIYIFEDGTKAGVYLKIERKCMDFVTDIDRESFEEMHEFEMTAKDPNISKRTKP